MLWSMVIGGVVQVILFSIIPLIWWYLKARNTISFLEWIELKSVEKNQVRAVIKFSVLSMVAFLLLSILILNLLKDLETTARTFDHFSFENLVDATFHAFINTGLSEEILFRGFLLKRIMNRFSFGIAILIQSCIFGVLHVLFFIQYLTVPQMLLVFVFIASIAYFMG